jgi:Mrp family chromosome partitioning ATPase
MTALDQALIKAFRRPARSGSATAEPAAIAPQIAVGPAVPLSQALAELAATPASPPTFAQTEPMASIPTMAPVGPSITALLDAAVGAECTGVEPIERAEADVAASVDANSQMEEEEPSAGTCEEIDPLGGTVAAAVDRQIVVTPFVETQEVHNTFSATTVTVHTPTSDPLSETLVAPTSIVASTGDTPTPTPAHTVTISQELGEAAWQPLLQVDRVVWPNILNRLQAAAPAAVQQMVDGFLGHCDSGSNVLGLASCASGEGVTTFLVAAARKLIEKGRKVVLVDANWSNPQLAQSLSLLPQIGWEETLCGGLPLEEVVIESLADGLAVLPVREPSASPIMQAQIAASFDILAREYDVVLVDLGPLAEDSDDEAAWQDMAARMDAVVLVQNVRSTTPNRLAEARQRLAAANLRHAGTIQNFVAG